MIMTTDDTKIAGLRSKERSRDHDLQPSLKQMTKEVWRKSLNRTSVNIVFDVLCLCLRQIQKDKANNNAGPAEISQSMCVNIVFVIINAAM